MLLLFWLFLSIYLEQQPLIKRLQKKTVGIIDEHTKPKPHGPITNSGINKLVKKTQQQYDGINPNMLW